MAVQCERCETEHDGSYGSGRFCSALCARGFATAAKREKINRKVAKTLKGYKPHFSPEERQRQVEAQKATKLQQLLDADWDSLSIDRKKRRVVVDQDNKCLRCGIDSWQGDPLTLQVDHADGNSSNNSRENLRGLCPNCHSQTPTYCGKKRNLGNDGTKSVARVTDEMLLAALLSSQSMSQALAKVGYSRQKRHFDRSKKLLREYSLRRRSTIGGAAAS